MVAEILGRDTRLRAQSRRGESRLRRRLCAARGDGAELGLFEVDEAALPEVARPAPPAAVCLLDLFRDQLTATENSNRRTPRAAVRALDQMRPSLSTETTRSWRPARSERERVFVVGLDTSAGPCRSPARGRLEVLHPLRHAVCPRRRYSATSATTTARAWPCASRARRSSLRNVELSGLESASFDLATPTGHAALRLRLPGLYIGRIVPWFCLQRWQCRRRQRHT